MKRKSLFVCTDCGFETARWYGKCPGCDAWNTLEEVIRETPAAAKPVQKRSGGTGAQAEALPDIAADRAIYQSTGIPEFDRVLGGGVVEGSLLLIGGEPGEIDGVAVHHDLAHARSDFETLDGHSVLPICEAGFLARRCGARYCLLRDAQCQDAAFAAALPAFLPENRQPPRNVPSSER